ncbi:hypothetical protein, partial [Lentimicrobium sp.]|uniref:hypothetical protein n=1 Tax=Lentimicrobium sp. TaxID=2034841 RepID=UPI002B9C6DF2
MKKRKLYSLSILMLTLLLAMFATSRVYAQASSEVILANDVVLNNYQIEFDLYVKSTNNSTYPDGFPYANGQFRINFNNAIRTTGGNTALFFEILPGSSELTNPLQVNTTVNQPSLTGSFVRIPGELPGSLATASIISPDGNGTKIFRMRMTSRDATTLDPIPFVANTQANLTLSTSSPGGTLTYYFTPAGLTALCSPQVLTSSQLVNPILNPTVTCDDPIAFNVTGSGSYCEGGFGIPVGLDGSQLGVNYTIIPGTQVIAGTGSAITFDVQLAGTYTVTATSDGTNPDICTDPVAMTGEAVITTMPLVTSTVSIAADPAGPVCEGTTVTFTATPVNGGDQPAYEWFVGGISQGIDFSGSFSYVPVNGDAVYVVMTPDVFCSAGDATSSSIDMVVEEPLPVSVSIEADYTEVCAGTSVTFTAAPVNGGTPDYQWYLNGNTVGNNSAIYSVTPANGDQVYVVMNSSLGCTTGNPATSNTIAITVNPLLTPSVSIVADPAGAVTTGTTVTFTATPVNGGVPTYEWFVNGSSVATGNPYAYIPLNGDEVYVIMTSTEACVTTATAVSDIITMVVEDVILPPVAFEMTGGGSYCEGEAGVVVGLSGSEIGVTYTLYQDAVAVASTPGTGAALDFGLRPEGVYTASGTNLGGTTDMTGSAIVIENALPVVTCPADMDVCINAGGQTLAGGNPTGGVYSGTGVTDGIFYPAVAGVGAHTITYTYEDMETGCSNFCTFTITVLDIPAAAGLIDGPATVTEGDMGVAYNVGVIANAASYVWAYSGTGVTINGTGNMVTLDFAIGASSGVLSVYGVNGCGMGAASFFDITVEPLVISCTETTWTGLVDEDWFNAGNWDPCVPNAETDVTIPGGVPNFPTLTEPAAC